MATGGIGDDGMVQEDCTANEDYEVGKETGTGNQGNTRKHQGDLTQAKNQNESGGNVSWVGKDPSWVFIPLLWVGKIRSWAGDICRKIFSRPVSQSAYIDVYQNRESDKVICTSVITRNLTTPYRFKFDDPAHIITGISCLPKDAETSSPAAEVISGGIGCKEVEIVLTPVQKGEWCCCVQINGIEENLLENSISN